MNRKFRVRYGDSITSSYPIHAGVPQGSVLGPTLYLIYTADIPQNDQIITSTFADDTAILTTGRTAKESTETLQAAINTISTWTKKWRIKINNTKSVHVDFTNLVKPGLKIKTVYLQQITNLQACSYARLDLWHTLLGLYQQKQYKNH